jgi:hypothetical protein
MEDLPAYEEVLSNKSASEAEYKLRLKEKMDRQAFKGVSSPAASS